MNRHIAAVLAVNQPTPEGGPFEGILGKFLNLLYYFSGVVALAALLGAVIIYAYQKITMQKSDVLNYIGMTLVLVGIGAGAAQIVNWATGT
ncbi:hypothetical protein [Nocardia wallacei]|uniref:hypothetical protein n=1 Tax=Nocardia wallacei TaxID=480035 RepID=UPI0024563820|nr:hypothetical protein [Nocardia wallacei]